MKNSKKYQSLRNHWINITLRNQLISDYENLVKYIARSIYYKINGQADIEDLINSGMLGLIDAIDKFDISVETKFKSYAEFRIRGAIYDELRAQDYLSRSQRDVIKKIIKAKNTLEIKLQRTPLNSEIASALNLTLEKYNKESILLNLTTQDINNLPLSEEPKIQTNHPEENIFNKQRLEILKDHISKLPDDSALVINLYYFQSLSLNEIAKLMNLSESRISQIHKSTIRSLKNIHNKYKAS